MTAPLDALFAPFSLKTMTLPNRVVMAPMTRVFSPEGIPGQNVADYYARRAENNVGLILTEGTVIERPASKNEAGIPNIYGKAIDGWKAVVDAVHTKGGRIAPQIWHTGAVPGQSGYSPAPLDTPSGLHLDGTPAGALMTDADIADTIAAFAHSASEAKRIGFDALELHGAHGYLIDEFFWAQTNQRTDQWGGKTIGERTRFAVEILKAVRAAVGPDFPIIIRLSQFKPGAYDAKVVLTPDEMAQWLQPLVDAGADILHCSQRRFWEPEFANEKESSDLNFAGWAKKLTGVPTISVGSVGLSGEFIAAFGGETSQPASIDGLLERLDRKEFDLVAVGRALLADPEWVEKIRTGRGAEAAGFDRSLLGQLV